MCIVAPEMFADFLDADASQLCLASLSLLTLLTLLTILTFLTFLTLRILLTSSPKTLFRDHNVT
jgi:hypothetical protein